MSDALPFRILFVCTGNTCRSPLAEALARREVRGRGWRHVEVMSAGTSAHPGATISDGSLQAGAAHGLDLATHEARRLDQALVEQADVILTMSASHLAVVQALGGEGKADLLTSFVNDAAGGVPDPFGGPLSVYLETYEALDRLVGQALDRLERVLDP